MRRAPDVSMPAATGGASAKEAKRSISRHGPNLRAIRLGDSKVGAASAVPDQAFTGMLEVDADSVTFEKLAPSEVFNQAGSHFDFGTLDAKLGSAMAKVSPSSFLSTAQARKHAATREGKRFLGRRVAHLTDQHLKIIEADGAVYDIEHLLNATMTKDNLQAFP